VKFLVDNQLPTALARLITSQGHECEHVLDIGLACSSDREIWEYARKGDRIVITMDDDFLYLANRSESEGRLIWVRLGNCRTSVLLAEFGRLWPRIVAALEGGERVVEMQ
jgi:predicted nuclease of predicted toxin-antitoxin system